ncbi:hypothetical protein SELMODRAFT_269840 [Selaginella moellendorffii]|uniref:Protein kinase domain-containing protein n=1 Tax=Selaginella moellendorffii TaxID=88036 RepID=D8T7U1_SELML|nr:probable leucine-rich repeat receptor-like protein kinase At1g68400 isoform X1 [Selaginella moellendorffii]EFJ07257.1 hypothetical protein SELMODRAFT_269840 [Selaginella moellendorffii]|eukprot:XP_002991686.1 probable leucine-rich repeat receptor-like protein kinase At1g68400 isoform X1 [Selaginella moellendorffii]
MGLNEELIAVVVFLLVSMGCSDLDSDREALLSFKEKADLKQTLGSSWTGNNPCTDNWDGVICNSDNRVVKLRLENRRFPGVLENGLGQLTELKVLSLKGNNLTGRIPSDLSRCRRLQKLYLNSNRLEGSIPEALLTLQDLDRVDVSNNHLSGSIPAAIGGLRKLLTLRLEMNSLTGGVPDVSNIPNLTDFNVSWNNLSGPVPSAMASRYPTAYVGNSALCGPPSFAPCPPKSRTQKPSQQIIVIIAVAVIGAFVLSFSALFFGYRYLRASSKDVDKSDTATTGTEKKEMASGDIVFVTRDAGKFQLADLLQASAELLGKGSLGSTYKALCTGGFVAVKRLVDRTGCSKKVFERRMGIVGRMTHTNLLRLRAFYFYARIEKLLVYDYMPKRSLHNVLHGNSPGTPSRLSWSKRLKISLGVARCLKFLHHQCKLPHGNIKSSNVLLTERYEARVSDFGLLPFVPSDQALEKNGYRAPECQTASDISRKADVFSFGVILLELLTGKLPAEEESSGGDQAGNSSKMDLPSWAIATVNDEWTSAVFDNAIEVSKQEQMNGLLKVAMACVTRAAEERPKMIQVVQMIEEVEAIEVSPDLSYI